MYEILNLLSRLPKAAKAVLFLFLIIPVCYVLARLLGIEKYWWVFALGALAIAGLVLLFNMAVKAREKRQGSAFEGELRRDAQRGASKEEVRQALGDLSAKWSEAVAQLKQSGLDIYSLPWYLLIGEPQSGKSTTLKNSGLEFPVGSDALSGAGGTRNCDWWFANEAVILDTAGRFTFQEESAPDQAEWASFLKLLHRYRKFCPINGVLVVIPCTSLLEDTPEEQERKAANIRQKLLHIQRVLEIRFPVFILVTKADRVLGFSEFFLKLDPVDQQQLVGWSNPEGTSKAFALDTFDSVYDEITTRLYKLRLKFLGDEENPSQADKLYVFPEEFRALKAPLHHYFKTIFQQTRFDEPFAFRGFYFSSGVQQGRPIAQATRDLLDVPGGAGAGVLENLESIFKKSRAFFIRHFYEKKVFPEQGLISRTAAAEARQRKVLWLVRGLGVLVLLLFLGGMIPAWRSLQGVLNPIRKSVKEAQACVQKGCSVADSYRIASDLQREREQALKHRFWFTLFLRGTRENELFTTLSAVQHKVYLGGVVQPLLKDTEARMGALDWAAFTPQYRVFFLALKQLLDWRAYKLPPAADQPAIVKAEDVKLLNVVDFARKTKGMKASDKSQEIDTWIAALSASDPGPDRDLEGALRPGKPLEIVVPDPDRPLTKFEEFWGVANLARWDFTLMDGLKKFADLYAQMTQVPRAEPGRYLGDVVDVGKRFRDNYDATTKHMATPRPGETGFPGATLDQWKDYLRKDYAELLKWKPVAPGRISEARRDDLIARLDVDYGLLTTRRSDYAYLLDGAQPKPAWSRAAGTLAAMLNDLTTFSDLQAFAASDDGKLVEQLATMTSWEEKPKRVDEWRGRQDAQAKGILAKASEVATSNPDPRYAFAERRPVIEMTTQLALLWRMLPTARRFFDESLVSQCPPSNCYQPVFARSMIPAASAIVSASANQRAAAGFEGVGAAIKGLADTENTYLKRYIDQMAGHLGGGGGFLFPSAAASAVSWPSFQKAVASWPIQGSGGGGAPQEASGQLSVSDMQTFAASNQYLGESLDYYRTRIERRRAAEAAGAVVAPELLEAANAFKGSVSAASDQPLRAWQQLARSEAGGPSLKQYMAFSVSPRLRNNSTALRMKREVEDHGAHLLRDAIRPVFAPREAVVFGKLNACCLGKFPFINELQLQLERSQFASGQAYSRSGGSGAAYYRVELPTVGMADISGAIVELGALADEFALDPIFSGEAREFDFVGEHRPILGVACAWDRFLFTPGAAPGQPGAPKEHKIEIRSVEKPPTQGAIFIGDRVGQVTFFDRSTILRPSTDVKTGRTPPPYVWRLAAAESPLSITGRNEETARGWTGTLDILGGPLKLFYWVRRASEDRKPGQDDRIWTVRVEVPDAERASTKLQGVFELKFDEAVPGVIPR
jgi:hypothetical protein